MVTIAFNCPNCGSLCAFKDIYVGRRARCLNCNQIFIIPQTSSELPQKIRHTEEFDELLPGFYEAVFRKSLPAIFNRQGLATLVFILFAATLKFFSAHLDFSFTIVGRSGQPFVFLLPVGRLITFFVWGGLFYCFAEIIYATAFDIESLPEITFNGGFSYIWSALKSIYSFFIAMFVSFLPAAICRYILSLIGVDSQLIFIPFVVLGMFLFPMAVLIVSIGRDLTMLFVPKYFLLPITKAFKHYLFIAGLFILVAYLQYITVNYAELADRSKIIVLFSLLAVWAVQILTIFTMRVIGLFYRHFGCFFEW